MYRRSEMYLRDFRSFLQIRSTVFIDDPKRRKWYQKVQFKGVLKGSKIRIRSQRRLIHKKQPAHVVQEQINV